MKKVLVAGLALLVAFAFVFVGCGGNDEPKPKPKTKSFDISWDLNWPEDMGEPPTGPVAVTVKSGAKLTSADIPRPTTAQSPYNHSFAGWYDSSVQGSGNRIDLNTEYKAKKTYYAHWEELTIDLTGKDVEKITLKNNYYPVYQFTLPPNKTWGDYKTFSFEVATDSRNYNIATQGFRVYGNYKAPSATGSGDFSFWTGDDDTDVEGKKFANAPTNNSDIEINKNGPYIMHNGGGARPSALYESNGSGGEPMEWVVLTFPDFDLMSPHNQFTADPINSRNKPKDNDTGPFYFGIGLPDLTYWAKNVKLVGKEAADTVTAVPAIFKAQSPGNDKMEPDTEPYLYPVFVAGWETTNGDDGFKETVREFANPTGNSDPITITFPSNSVDIIFDYNYPSGTGITAGTAPSEQDRTKTTDGGGKLNAAQLAPLTGNALPYTDVGFYRFDNWYTTDGKTPAQPGAIVGTGTVFTTNGKIYARWKEPLPKASTALVVEGNELEFETRGNNAKATYASGAAAYTNAGDGDAYAIGDGEYVLMMGNPLANKINGRTSNNDSLATVKFPDGIKTTLYNKVTVYYDTVIPTSITGGETATVAGDFYPNGESNATLGGNMKRGYNNWDSPVGGDIFPSFESGTGKSITWDLAAFGADLSTGLSIQYNASTQASPKVNGWLLRITKLEFTYVEPGT